MEEHRERPSSEAESAHDPAGESELTRWTSPSVAPIAMDLDPIEEEPEALPEQSGSKFARNVIAGGALLAVGFAIFGVARSLTSGEPEKQARVTAAPVERLGTPTTFEPDMGLAEAVGRSLSMSVSLPEALRIANRANAAARMSLERPVEPMERGTVEPMVTPKASEMESTAQLLIDAAATAAQLRCLNASEAEPPLVVHVRFAPDGTASSVWFDGGAKVAPETLACVEEVLGELSLADVQGRDSDYAVNLHTP